MTNETIKPTESKNEQVLSDPQMQAIIAASVQLLFPIVNKYQITDVKTNTALAEAFQAGVKFTLDELRNV